MYTINKLIRFLQGLIDKERKQAYASIYIVIGGIITGTLLGALFFSDADFMNILVQLSGLGISLSTIAGVCYYLYKYDEKENRKKDFLVHLDQEIKQGSIADRKIDPKLSEIIIKMLQDKMEESPNEPMIKKDEK